MNRKQDGMTLIEVILAITLLSMVMLTFAYVFIQFQQVTTNNGDRLTALQLAQKRLSDVLENLPNDPGKNVQSPTAEPSHTNYTVHDGADTATIDHGTYQTYVYVIAKDNDGKQMVVVRTYYSNTNYVELYNYSTTSSSQGASENDH
ncbi:prepilin-type N-terminal cleavage/methylation domain-containing protein [Sporolactobacillus kofuensis]|uniref:Prepilin-type N-terminal cleavage/methylation domain-containing protein n=1 Tax=Sporolactobacillus kofuensis TaxID=269672 RepID=A0ABW1WBV9_9BACL|nr:type II secretion system protein [Sporolactobacillus kofuensis]MCO7175621.1 type II secretion system GspH family protein [Sporolactobacillus kofuensis]